MVYEFILAFLLKKFLRSKLYMYKSTYSPFFILYAIYEIFIFFIRALFAGKNPIILLKEEEEKQQRDFQNSASEELLQLLSNQRQSYKKVSDFQ